jgi:hypothetical protein
MSDRSKKPRGNLVSGFLAAKPIVEVGGRRYTCCGFMDRKDARRSLRASSRR